MHRKFANDNGATSAFSFDTDKKPALVKHIITSICTELSLPAKPDDFFTNEIITNCVENMEWKKGLIYSDWQSAIGDLMITPSKYAARKYDVIGYKEFEELYDSEDPKIIKWVERVDRLFKNLDVINPGAFDVRPEELSCIFVSTYPLLKTTSEITTVLLCE